MKTEIIRARLNEAERDIFLKNAKALNMTISDYIKYCCILNPPKSDLEREVGYK